MSWERFDFKYLRFDLGHLGVEALGRLRAEAPDARAAALVDEDLDGDGTPEQIVAARNAERFIAFAAGREPATWRYLGWADVEHATEGMEAAISEGKIEAVPSLPRDLMIDGSRVVFHLE